jgi:hypothetical protein
MDKVAGRLMELKDHVRAGSPRSQILWGAV